MAGMGHARLRLTTVGTEGRGQPRPALRTLDLALPKERRTLELASARVQGQARAAYPRPALAEKKEGEKKKKKRKTRKRDSGQDVPTVRQAARRRGRIPWEAPPRV